MSTFSKSAIPDAPAAARTPYVPPATVKSVTDAEEVDPTTAKPALFGALTVTSLNDAAA